jgi:hypothetical protein
MLQEEIEHKTQVFLLLIFPGVFHQKQKHEKLYIYREEIIPTVEIRDFEK